MALVLDGKTFAEAYDGRRAGHHDDGGQTVPGFVETDTEKRAGDVTPFLRGHLVERGLDVSQVADW